MDVRTPALETKHSIGSAGDLHDATPVVSTMHDRRRTSSSDGTRAADDDMIKSEQHAEPLQGAVVPAGPPFRKFGHKCAYFRRQDG